MNCVTVSNNDDVVFVRYELNSEILENSKVIGSFITRLGTSIMNDGINHLVITDAIGELGYQLRLEKSDLLDRYFILLDRAAIQYLNITYEVAYRKVDKSTKSGPYYDLRKEENGITFSDKSVFIEFSNNLIFPLQIMTDEKYYSNGTTSGYYAIGNYHWLHKDNYTMIACTKPEFNFKDVFEKTHNIYTKMCERFHVTKNYAILVRKDPYLSQGGSSSSDAFMIGYCDQIPFDLDIKYHVLAHELAHSFLIFDDQDEVKNTWLNEGFAEYISTTFPYEYGLRGRDYYINSLNEISKRLYDNPYREYSIERALKESWNDTKYIQPLPYGRGFFILCYIDKLLHQNASSLLDFIFDFKVDIYNYENLINEIMKITKVDIRNYISEIEEGKMFDLTECYFLEDIHYKLVDGEHREWFEFY